MEYNKWKYFGIAFIAVVDLMMFDWFFGFGYNKLFVGIVLLVYGGYLAVYVQILLNERKFGTTVNDYILEAMAINWDIILKIIVCILKYSKNKEEKDEGR